MGGVTFFKKRLEKVWSFEIKLYLCIRFRE
jgi:hypothetical protein